MIENQHGSSKVAEGASGRALSNTSPKHEESLPALFSEDRSWNTVVYACSSVATNCSFNPTKQM